MEKRCYECMEPIGEAEVCPHCGFENKKANLKPDFNGDELLKERYYVGNIFSKTLDSTVYKAYDTALGKKVFLREFTGENITKISNKYTATELKQKFLNYAKGTATLNMSKLLPHTVDAFAENKACYLVTDYFDGESLKTLLNSGIKISASNALKMAKQLLNGLQSLHNSGFIFGAISPETLYILKNGEVRIFGLAYRFYDFLEDVDSRVELLNPSYAAPELFEENSKISTRCDVYSVAAILYRVLTDKIPAISFLRHGGENLKAPHKVNKNIPKNISKALLNAMNWQIENRTANAGAFLDELSSKKVKRIRSGAIIWANILGFFQRIYDKFAGNGKEEDKKPRAFWFWITTIIVLFIAFTLFIFFVFPTVIQVGNDGENSSGASTSSEDGWYYGSGVETHVNSDYYYSGQSSKDSDSSRKQSSDRNNTNTSSGKDPNSTECPDLTGYLLEQARSMLEEKGLLLGEVIYRTSDDYLPNYVMAQSLKRGGMVQKGTKIDLIVCSGPKSAELPSVSGLSMKQAKERLSAKGFTNIEYKFVVSDDAPGTVIEVYFEDEAKATKADKVIIAVSGEDIGLVLDYSGETGASAQSKSPDINFVFIGEDGAAISDSEATSYIVISQDISANTPAYKGMTITLTVRR